MTLLLPVVLSTETCFRLAVKDSCFRRGKRGRHSKKTGVWQRHGCYQSCCFEEGDKEDFAHVGPASFTHGICRDKELHSPVTYQDDSV